MWVTYFFPGFLGLALATPLALVPVVRRTQAARIVRCLLDRPDAAVVQARRQ